MLSSTKAMRVLASSTNLAGQPLMIPKGPPTTSFFVRRPAYIVVNDQRDEQGNIWPRLVTVDSEEGKALSKMMIKDDRAMGDIRVRAALNAPHKRPKPKPVAERAREWLEKNPKVYAEFKRFFYEAIMAGVTKMSADMIAHRVRWESKIKSGGKDDFKVNNNVVAFMARRIIEEDPRQADVFEFRKSPHAASEGQAEPAPTTTKTGE